MKSERRHELEKNVLADRLGGGIQAAKPFSIGVQLNLLNIAAGRRGGRRGGSRTNYVCSLPSASTSVRKRSKFEFISSVASTGQRKSRERKHRGTEDTEIGSRTLCSPCLCVSTEFGMRGARPETLTCTLCWTNSNCHDRRQRTLFHKRGTATIRGQTSILPRAANRRRRTQPR